MLQVLKRPEVQFRHIEELLGKPGTVEEELYSHVECAVKYVGYIDRQKKDIKAVRHMERKVIPIDFPYGTINGLSTEARQKLATKRPETVAQASRISGVRASDLSIIAVHLERFRASHDRDSARARHG